MSDAPRSTISAVLPVKGNVLYPHLLLPLAVGRAASVAAVEAALVWTDGPRLMAVPQAMMDAALSV